MPDTPESWKNYSYDDPQRHWYEVLVQGNGKLDIPTLAQRWLQDLADTGLQEVETTSGAPPKEPASYYPRTEPLHSDIVPIRLEGSRGILWLKPNGRRSGAGYKRAEILDYFLSTDRAILAALTALEAREAKPKDLSDDLISGEVDFSDEEWPMPGDAEYEKIDQELAQLVDEGFMEEFEEDWTKELLEFRHVYDDTIIQTTHTVSYLVALLRYYRPEFSSLSRKERVALVREGCNRVVKFLEALRHLEAFLEYWAPEKDLKPKVSDAARDIMAAELQDVEGLSNLKLGERLGVVPPPSDAVKRTNSTAGAMAKRGRSLLQSNLGEEEWHKLVEEKRAQRDEYWSRSEEERHLLQFAEREGLLPDQARRLIDQANKDWDQNAERADD